MLFAKAAPLTTQNKEVVVMNERIERVITALRKNNMQGIYVPCINDITKTVEALLTPDCTIAAGGSVSLVESGVWELINRNCYKFSDRNREGITPEERQAVFRGIIGCDFYFCSTNAITENGELLNVDGFANRISAIAFGPKKVIMIAGANKIVRDLNEAFLRVKKVAAPKNCLRLGIDSPCAKLGHCVSLLNNNNPSFTDGCNTDGRICANYLISGRQRDKDRITVIICGENLGY